MLLYSLQAADMHTIVAVVIKVGILLLMWSVDITAQWMHRKTVWLRFSVVSTNEIKEKLVTMCRGRLVTFLFILQSMCLSMTFCYDLSWSPNLSTPHKIREKCFGWVLDDDVFIKYLLLKIMKCKCSSLVCSKCFKFLYKFTICHIQRT